MRILVCDDEQRYCQIINEYILANFDENSEGVIEIFNSAKELVEFCLKNEPDVLFLDIELGDINGIEVAKYLRNEFPTLIIVYITNHPDYVFSCFETEPLNFLKKPIDKIEFDKTFQRIIKNEMVGKIDEIYNFLKVHGFVKSHQGFVVNMLHIKDFGESEIRMKNGESVLMSVRKRLKTKEAYSEYINRRF